MAYQPPALTPAEVGTAFRLLREEAQAHVAHMQRLTEPLEQRVIPTFAKDARLVAEVRRIKDIGLVEEKDRQGFPPFSVNRNGQKALQAAVMARVLDVVRDLNITRDKWLASENAVIHRVESALQVDSEYRAELESSVREALRTWFA